jgi:hypothetical protein
MARKNNLAEVLQTEVTGSMPLKTLAKVLASKGRRGDTMLAHITPKEAKKLKKAGGAGTTNPETGLPEFFDGEDFTTSFQPADVPQPPTTFTQEQGPSYSELTSYQPPTFRSEAAQDFVQPNWQTVYSEPGSSNFNVNDIISNQLGQTAAATPGTFLGSFDNTKVGTGQYAGDFGQFGATIPQDQIQNQLAASSGVGNVVSPPGATGDQTTGDQKITTPPPSTDQQQKTPEQQKSFTDKLLAGLSEPKNILGLGIAGAGGLLGYLGQQRAAQQAKAAQAQIAAAYNQAAQQQKDLAAPLIGPGYTQLSQALQGALSPANQQAYQIAQARAAQASARSGGVGAVQAALQEEGLRQQLLAGQQTQALALIAPGNTMLQNAIQNQINATTQGLGVSLQLQQQANQAANQMYAALGGAVAGGMLKG